MRQALGLQEGDTLAYEIRDGLVVLSRVEHGLVDDPFAHFDEWDGAADREAYADL